MLPEQYLKKMKELLKDEYDDYLNSFNLPKIKSLRINTNKINVDDFLSIFPYQLEKIPWSFDGFYFEDDNVYTDLLYYAGLFYIQEASAMLPAEILPIEENDVVLDACASPGGKSLKILNKLNNSGLLLANDISSSRANGLLRNIERQGFINYFVSIENINDLKKKYLNTFDKILVDAPCSGEGMFRKDNHLINEWLNKNNDYYANIQKEIMDNVIPLLKDGGKLLYSTCTFDNQEDEDIMEYILNKYDDLKILPIKMYEGFKEGRDGLGVKLFPHRIKGEGHYLCLIQKGNDKKPSTIKKELIQKPDYNFFKLINKDFYNGNFKIINDHLYFVPNFDTSGIRILRSGLLLGQIKNNDLKPSSALALALNKNEFKYHLDLDDVLTNKYLKGETINHKTDINDYLLACFKGFPLGFLKKNNNQLKNLLDKGWVKK